MHWSYIFLALTYRDYGDDDDDDDDDPTGIKNYDNEED